MIQALSILLADLAGAAPPKPPDPLCPPAPEIPTGWRLDWGLASGRNEAEAIRSAQQAATDKLLAASCQGTSELRCAAAARGIAPWGTASFDKRRQSACAPMVIKLDALYSYERDLEELDAKVADLAAALTAAAGPSAIVSIAPPTWPSGCVAGDLGYALAAQLRTSLAKLPLRLASAPDLAAGVLSIGITPGGQRAVVHAGYRPAGEGAEIPLPGFSFPLDLYGLSPSEAGRCAPRDRMGLEQRTGRDGLRVSLHVPADGGRLCEGKRVTAEVYTNRPARIQIWSVLEDGRAFLIGPDPSLVPGGLLSRPGPVLHIDPLALPELGDEWLVAVAIPEGEPAQAATAPCRAGLWSAARLPQGSAVSSQTWTVLPEGTGGCGAWSGASSRAEVEAVLAAMPLCAER